MLPFMVIFLAIQLIFMRNQPTPDPRASTAILAEMQTQCQSLRDLDIVTTQRTLEGKLGQEVQAKTLTQQQADHVKFQGQVLVAMAKLKSGEHFNTIGKLEAAYQTLHGEWKAKQATEE